MPDRKRRPTSWAVVAGLLAVGAAVLWVGLRLRQQPPATALDATRPYDTATPKLRARLNLFVPQFRCAAEPLDHVLDDIARQGQIDLRVDWAGAAPCERSAGLAGHGPFRARPPVETPADGRRIGFIRR